MISALLWSIGAAIVVSLLALVGILFISINKRRLEKILLVLVGLSAGALLGGAFLHLIPEAVEEAMSLNLFIYILVGFVGFFFIERVMHWHHCHKTGSCEVHDLKTFKYMNLIGDSIHNFIDGLIIAASFLVNTALGISTTIAIIAHEIPQEIGDFGVLVYGGWSRSKALFFNFLTALTSVAGAIVGYFLASATEHFTIFLVPFAAGGFIYIAASDLIPELHREARLKKSLMSFLFFLIGIGLMLGLKLVFES